MPRVRFCKHAAWRGVGFRPGDETDMDPATAEVYVRTGQAVQAPDPPPAETAEAAAIAAKPAVERAGLPVETAAAPKREKRGTRRTKA